MAWDLPKVRFKGMIAKMLIKKRKEKRYPVDETPAK
jgi:hypothetical protein